MTTRHSIRIEGFDHGAQPIPAACRRGALLVTGGVHGVDRTTGRMPDTVAAQTANMFDNLRAILRAAGASFDDIVKVTVYTADPGARDAVNAQWCRYFPDPADRPARHTQTRDKLPGAMRVQCDAIAFITSGDAPP
jgi:enamine deaminase RidA (YjgF/YER057c/UK114 family)